MGRRVLINIPTDANYIEILGYRIDGYESFEVFLEHLYRYEETEDRLERFKGFINAYINPHIVMDAVESGELITDDIMYLFDYPEIADKSVIRKPPLGVMSKKHWLRERQIALSEAMTRYLEAGMKIPKEWIEEYNAISDQLESRDD